MRAFDISSSCVWIQIYKWQRQQVAKLFNCCVLCIIRSIVTIDKCLKYIYCVHVHKYSKTIATGFIVFNFWSYSIQFVIFNLHKIKQSVHRIVSNCTAKLFDKVDVKCECEILNMISGNWNDICCGNSVISCYWNQIKFSALVQVTFCIDQFEHK